MICLGLVWWVLWRGAVVGALFGTFMWPVVGTIYGAFLGAILGFVLGLINVISLVFIKRLYRNLPNNPSDFIKSSIFFAILLDLVVILMLRGVMGATGLIVEIILATLQLALIIARRSELSVLFRP